LRPGLRFVGRCYRAHDPRWSFSPLSGHGATITGGRFNRKGQAALYLALDPITAIAEVTQGFANRLHPLLLCEYDVDCEDIADLRTVEGRAELGVSIEVLDGPWLTFQRAGKIAPSQKLAASLQADGFVGAIVPSFAPGVADESHNLILWSWSEQLPHKVRVFDPDGRLPQDQSSWG
jgi:RES domain-containing protein